MLAEQNTRIQVSLVPTILVEDSEALLHQQRRVQDDQSETKRQNIIARADNVKETQHLKKPLKEIRVGSYSGLATAYMETPVMDVIHMLVKKNISSVPILEHDGTVVNVFESVDVIALIKGGAYDDLSLTVGQALLKRSEDFSGIYTCSLNDRLDTIFDTIRRSRVHRFVIIDEYQRLKGILTLSDILEYILLEGESEET